MPSDSFSYGSLRFTRPRLKFDFFQNLDADPADTIRTVTDSVDAIRTITDRYGRAIRSIRRIRFCVSDYGISSILLTLTLSSFFHLTIFVLFGTIIAFNFSH